MKAVGPNNSIDLPVYVRWKKVNMDFVNYCRQGRSIESSLHNYHCRAENEWTVALE